MSEPCVIACLAGGLGNQLFMYAFNRAMAERNGVPFKLDVVSGFERDRTYRRSHLLHLILPPAPTPSRWQSRRFPFGRMLRKLDRKLNALLPLQRRYYVQERTMRFDPEIRNLKIVRPTVFNGYWQAPQYFDDLVPSMAELIRFPEHLTTPLADELSVIRNASNPVCLAIRRYEEVPKPKHHILQVDYFQQAMARMEAIVPNPHYFVFSQHMEWARANIKSRHPVTFAREKDLHAGAIQDLFLMTQCRHFILSNSTLHWWAAWLAPLKGTVIVPARGWPNADMVLPHWIQLC
jgi:hypothetical protein